MKRLFLIALLFFANPSSGVPNTSPASLSKASEPNQSSHPDVANPSVDLRQLPIQSPSAPIVLNVYPASEGKVLKVLDSDVGHEGLAWKDIWEAIVALATGVLALITGYLVFYTKNLWGATVELSREAKAASARQESEMKQSIAQAIRSADAMEIVGEAARNNAALMQSILQKQMRAYLAFEGCDFIPQDVNANWKAEVRFHIKNFGHTPAQSINVSSALVILDLATINSGFDPALAVEEKNAAADASPGQSFFFRAYLHDFASTEEMARIKKLEGRALCLYGTVRYKDIFAESHSTNFFKICQWDIKDKLSVVNANRHNDST